MCFIKIPDQFTHKMGGRGWVWINETIKYLCFIHVKDRNSNMYILGKLHSGNNYCREILPYMEWKEVRLEYQGDAAMKKLTWDGYIVEGFMSSTDALSILMSWQMRQWGNEFLTVNVACCFSLLKKMSKWTDNYSEGTTALEIHTNLNLLFNDLVTKPSSKNTVCQNLYSKGFRSPSHTQLTNKNVLEHVGPLKFLFMFT